MYGQMFVLSLVKKGQRKEKPKTCLSSVGLVSFQIDLLPSLFAYYWDYDYDYDKFWHVYIYRLIVSVYILHPYCGRYIWSDFYSDPSEHICALNFIPIVLRALVISCWSGQITTHIFLHIVFGFSQIFTNIIYVGRYIWSMSFNLK